MILSWLSRTDQWLDGRFGLPELTSHFEKTDEAWASASILAGEGTLTPARLAHLKWRNSCLIRHARSVNTRLQQVKLALLTLVGVIILGELWSGHPWSALFCLGHYAVFYAIVPRIVNRCGALRLDRQEAPGLSHPAPHNAEYLLWLLLPREGREAAIGDIKEQFEIVLERFGSCRAKLWIWGEVARSAWPLVSYVGERLWKRVLFDWWRRQV